MPIQTAVALSRGRSRMIATAATAGVALGALAIATAWSRLHPEHPTIPDDGAVDSTVAALRDGYLFISRRCDRLRADAFTTRLMLRPVVCMRGSDAVAAFYTPGRLTRRRAMPLTTARQLQDFGSVQMLDGEAHRARKQMFLAILTASGVRDLVETFTSVWHEQQQTWGTRIVLYDEGQTILCDAVCRWAGIPLDRAGLPRLTRSLAATIDGAGSIGPRMWRGLMLRSSTEAWARDVIERARAGRLMAAPDRALSIIADHRNPDGTPLPTGTAAVELLNILRPVVAVARFITFAALALRDHPEERQRLQAGGASYAVLFAQEVRRHYPFFPAIGGRVRQPFEWRGEHFRKGEWLLLDLYGTNHDERIWGDPGTFRPERFVRHLGRQRDIVAQGAGPMADTHRCPGEDATIALTARAARLLASMDYEVPPQDVTIDLARLPALPRSGVVIEPRRNSAYLGVG